MLDSLAAAQRQGFVGDGLERQRLAAAHLFVGGDQRHGTHVNQPFLQRFGRKSAEHHRMGGADARARLHGDHAFH
ncbi:hypothetical protein D3C86_1839750 [compost metagenome]